MIKATPYALLGVLGAGEALHLMNRGSSAYTWTETAYAIAGSVSNLATVAVSLAQFWSHIWTFRKRNDGEWKEKKLDDYRMRRKNVRDREEIFDEDVESFFDEASKKSSTSDANEMQPLLQ